MPRLGPTDAPFALSGRARRSIALVASILNASNKEDLLKRLQGKSQKDIEAMVADYRPPISFRDRAKPVCVVVPGPTQTRVGEAGSGSAGYSRSGSEKTSNAGGGDGSGKDPQIPAKPGDVASAELPGRSGLRVERKLLVQFLASEAFMKKFEEARALLSNRLPRASYEAVLESALDELLARRRPAAARDGVYARD